MKYGQLCWPFSVVGIVPADDYPYFSRLSRTVVILACGTANIGRVALLPLFFNRNCGLAIIIRGGLGHFPHRLSNPLIRGHYNVDAGSRSGCDRQAGRDLRGA